LVVRRRSKWSCRGRAWVGKQLRNCRYVSCTDFEDCVVSWRQLVHQLAHRVRERYKVLFDSHSCIHRTLTYSRYDCALLQLYPRNSKHGRSPQPRRFSSQHGDPTANCNECIGGNVSLTTICRQLCTQSSHKSTIYRSMNMTARAPAVESPLHPWRPCHH